MKLCTEASLRTTKGPSRPKAEGACVTRTGGGTGRALRARFGVGGGRAVPAADERVRIARRRLQAEPVGAARPGAAVHTALALAAFGIWELRTDAPTVPLALFRDRVFSGASFSLVLLTFANGGLMLVLTQYLQFVLGYSPAKTGIAFAPMAVATLVFNGAGATLGNRIGNRPMIAVGLTVIAAGFGTLASLSSDAGFGMVSAAMVLIGIGGGLAMPAATSALMSAVPAEHAGVGSALNDTVQQAGAALGVAVLGTVLSGTYTGAMPDSAPARASHSVSDALALAASSGDTALATAAREAFTEAMSATFWAGAAGVLAAAALAIILIRDPKTPASTT
ncbi:MFS transporter, partial [Streptomyces silaceus]|uniref:MFS transporter n=1 Tax=Streptomyces silaceus TaxID=545123 RepID=UPI001FC923CE